MAKAEKADRVKEYRKLPSYTAIINVVVCTLLSYGISLPSKSFEAI